MKLLLSILFSLFSFTSILFCQGGFEESSTLIYSNNWLHSNARYCLDDLNGDGNIDIIFGENAEIYYTDDNLEVQDTIVAGEYGAFPITTMDFTGNGLKDIFYFLKWFEALEDGTYIEHSAYPNGMYQTADFDNDGRTDVLIREMYTIQQNWVEIGWNNGMSDYENDVIDVNTYNSSFVKDLNGDNFSDFATLHDSLIVNVYINQQDSTFTVDTINLQTDINDERRYTTIKYGDIDNDGIGDIIGIGKGNYLFWLKGIGNGEFGAIQHYYLDSSISSTAKIRGFSVRDFNFDWSKDVAVIIENEDLVEVYLIWNTENGLSLEAEQIYSENLGYGVSIMEDNRILDKDVDGDGKTDIIIHLRDELIWMKNNHVQTSTEDVEMGEVSSISPNPFSTAFTISSDNAFEEEHLIMKMTDNIGKVILEKEITLPYSAEELGDLPKGVYFVSLSQKNDSKVLMTSKLVKL